MKITDQFQISLTSEQYDLLTAIFAAAADLELPPPEADNVDSLWDAMVDAAHNINFEEANS